MAEARRAPLSDAARAVLARAAAERLGRLDELAEHVAGAILASDQRLADDPAIAVELTASTRANIHRFLTAVAARPGERPPPDVPPEALDLARTFVRRDIDLEALAHAYRRGQNAAWREWFDACARHSPPELLPEVLAHGAELMFGFVDDVLTALIAHVEQERDELLAGASARRESIVRLLLEGAPLDADAAARQLGHRLDRFNTAFVVWGEDQAVPHGAAEQLATALAHAAGERRALCVSPTTTTLWGWLSTAAPVEPAALRPAADAAPPGVRVALGTSRKGPTGFRQSHEEALAAQRLVVGHATPDRLIAYRDVEVIALLGRDEERLRRFVVETLGPLAGPGRANARLRETLRVYLAEGDNAAATATRLGTHRNTALQRVARAQELLGHRIADRRLSLAVALEAAARLGLLAE